MTEDRLQLACQVCLSQYDPQDHRPLLLPACGHTFCAFCVEHLQRQGKRCCPKCRKDGAVQPVTSLPVNYSLLDVAQNSSCGAAAAAVAAAARPVPSSSHRTTDTKDLLSTKLHSRCHKVKRSNSLVTSRIDSLNHTTPAMPFLQNMSRMSAVNPSVGRGLRTPTLTALGARNPSHTQTALEREQQDELDFQMAIHLTFCKDASHDHDLHTSCSSWGW